MKVEELNRKYGESFGYYNTIAEWYDILTQKGEDYIQMLFLQAKAQSLVDKAVKADEEVAAIEANGLSTTDRYLAKVARYINFSVVTTRGSSALIRQNWHITKALKEATEKSRGYLAEAEELQRQMEELREKSHIGGFTAPEVSTVPTGNPEKHA